MDFSALEVTSDAVSVSLKHPVTDEVLIDEKSKEPVTVLLHGRDSEQYRKSRRKFLDERLKRSQNKGKAIDVTAEQIERQGLETLSNCIAGWSHVELDGKTLEFNTENFHKLIKRCPWVEGQIDEAIADRSNFMKTSLNS